MTGYVGPIEEATLSNDFRQVLFTGRYSQLVVMCLQPGEEIGNEADQAICQAERSLRDLGEKISAPDRAKREAQTNTLKETMRGEDLIEGEYRDT